MGCVDWELGASYLKWRARYGNSWEAKFRETYEGKVKELWDTHFYVGTVHGHPNNWIIVGLFPAAATGLGEWNMVAEEQPTRAREPISEEGGSMDDIGHCCPRHCCTNCAGKWTQRAGSDGIEMTEPAATLWLGAGLDRNFRHRD